MQPIDVIYFIEHIARELDVACAVKFLLAKQGIQVEICSLVNHLDDTLSRWRPRLVAIPYGTSVKDTNLEPIIAHWGSARYINLSYEQVLGKTQKSFKAPKDQFARRHLLYTAWGDFFARYLETYGVPPGHIVVTGNPALALYTNPYREYYGQARTTLATRFHLDISRQWVFVPENYGWAFFKDHQVRDRIRRGFPPEDAFRYRDFALNSLKAASIWWRDAARLDGVELIVRPRPATPEAHFRGTVTEFAGEIPPHLHIIKYGSVREWILASDKVFSSYSTTLLDAALADKPVYMLTPSPIPDFLHAEWYDLTQKVATFDAFAASIQSLPDRANWEPLQAWVINQMMSRGDAIANLARLIAITLGEESPVAPPLEVSDALHRFSLDRVWRKFRKVAWNFGQLILTPPHWASPKENWSPHEQDQIEPQDIDRRLARWEQILRD